MAAVDPDDDALRRYVVRRYTYDPSRRERRHTVVAAFDNKSESLHLLHRLTQDLQQRRAAGESVDPREHITGVTHEPGYRRRQQDARLLRAAIRHRVELSQEFLSGLRPRILGSLCRQAFQVGARIVIPAAVES